MYQEYNEDVLFCQKIAKKHGKSYYFATQFFPKEKRQATYALYAWMRIPDDIVDIKSEETKNTTIQKLKTWSDDWYLAYHQGQSDHPTLRLTAYFFKKFNIPFELSQSFLKSMQQDLSKKRYDNYQELEDYMYGSAGVVGIMMSYVIGFKNEEALAYAKKLGYAMQLTNFARDIYEDFNERDRIYFPIDEMTRFNVTEKDLKNKINNNNFKKFLGYQIQRSETLYTESMTGIKMLSSFGQKAVLISLFLYREIGRKITQNNYNIFDKRIKTTLFEKIILSIKAVFTKI